MTTLGIALAGAIGATARYLLDAVVSRRAGRVFPFGTFTVNVLGSLLLGVLAGLVLYHAFPRHAQAVLGVGFCGSFTTFSTFCYESTVLAEEGSLRAGLLNVTLSTVAGLAAAAAGLAAAAA